MSVPRGAGAVAGRCDRYDLFGTRVALAGAPPQVLDGVAASFSAFRAPADGRRAELELRIELRGDQVVLDEWPAGTRQLEHPDAILPSLLERLNATALQAMARRDIVAIHAAAVEHAGEALILAGPSGRGKTTLTLGLVRAGLRLLSDELALLAPDGTILPYPRSLHIRPGTPELIPELGRLREGGQSFGGGIRWAVSRTRLAESFPDCLAPAAPLGAVLLLEPRVDAMPRLSAVGAASAVIELLDGTPLVAHDFPRALRRVSAALTGARCARLQAGELLPTVDGVIDWWRRSRG